MSNIGLYIHQLAPIVLTVFNRPWHTEKTLNALKANDLADQSILYIYSDGPKYLADSEDLEKIKRVRQIAKGANWCKEVHVIESEYNLGLVNSFVKGVTEIINQYGKVIVLEDDQITSKGFLKYMNEALELYKNDNQVMHISAYMYPAKYRSKETTFFLNIQSCPGWGTWKRAWNQYNHDAMDHLNYFSKSNKLKKKFDIEGHAYFFKQLKKNAGQNNYSFAVRWYASCLRAGGLSLFPKKSLVKNIGLDGTGIHCKPTTMYDVKPVDYLEIKRIPLVENRHIRKSVDAFYKQHLKRKSSFSVKIFLNKIVRTMGIGKLKRMLRWSFRIIYPELSLLQNEGLSWVGLISNDYQSKIAKKAKLFKPYHLNKVTVDDYTYILPKSWISMASIGKFCSIGSGFHCGGGIHPVDGISTSPMFYSTSRINGTTLSNFDKSVERKAVVIGNDVFIGMNVTVLDGVSIGDGAVVGAGCIVSKDIPPFAVVAGNPMRIIRYRFPKNIRSQLSEIKWWDFSDHKISIVEKYFFEIEDFIEQVNNCGIAQT